MYNLLGNNTHTHTHTHTYTIKIITLLQLFYIGMDMGMIMIQSKNQKYVNKTKQRGLIKHMKDSQSISDRNADYLCAMTECYNVLTRVFRFDKDLSSVN